MNSKFIYLIIGCLILLAILEIRRDLARKDRLKAIRSEKCSEMIYVKIDSTTYKASRKQIFIQRYGDKIKVPCQSDIAHPIEADVVSAFVRFNIPEYKTQFSVQVTLYSQNKKIRTSQESFLDALERGHIKIEESSIEDNFNVYKRAYYQARDKELYDQKNDPLIFKCRRTQIPLGCSSGFYWDDGRYVFIYPVDRIDPEDANKPELKSMLFWKKLYPALLKEMKNIKAE